MKKKVLVIGSTCVDIRIEVEHMPKTEEDLSVPNQTLSVGGCAFNVANALRHCHIETTLFSPVGQGIYGTFVKDALHSAGIQPAVNVKEENGACYCFIEPDGNRTFIAVHGGEYHFQKEWFNSLDMTQYGAVYFCGMEMEEESGEAILSFLEETAGLYQPKLYYAPGPRGVYVSEERKRRIVLLHPIMHLNKSEAKQLLDCNSDDLEELAEMLSTVTHNETIITDGGNGACVFDPFSAAYAFVPAEKVNPVDGTGAGDSHIGVYIANRIDGQDFYKALKEANHYASRVVQTKGSILTE